MYFNIKSGCSVFEMKVAISLVPLCVWYLEMCM